MYQASLFLHNILRWVVIIAAVFAFVKATQSWIGKKEWSGSDKISGLIFTISLDVQILLGFLLYGISPIMKAAWSDIGAAMQNEALRFFAVEHLPLMIMAALSAHIGFRAGKSEKISTHRQRTVTLWYGLAIFFLFIGVPWFRPYLPF